MMIGTLSILYTYSILLSYSCTCPAIGPLLLYIDRRPQVCEGRARSTQNWPFVGRKKRARILVDTQKVKVPCLYRFARIKDLFRTNYQVGTHKHWDYFWDYKTTIPIVPAYKGKLYLEVIFRGKIEVIIKSKLAYILGTKLEWIYKWKKPTTICTHPVAIWEAKWSANLPHDGPISNDMFYI